MEILGKVDGPTYVKLFTQLQNEAPDLQSPECPFVILKKLNQFQILALQGYFKKQAYELNLFEVRAPNSDKKNLDPIPDEAYKYAREKVMATLTEILRK